MGSLPNHYENCDVIRRASPKISAYPAKFERGTKRLKKIQLQPRHLPFKQFHLLVFCSDITVDGQDFYTGFFNYPKGLNFPSPVSKFQFSGIYFKLLCRNLHPICKQQNRVFNHTPDSKFAHQFWYTPPQPRIPVPKERFSLGFPSKRYNDPGGDWNPASEVCPFPGFLRSDPNWDAKVPFKTVTWTSMERLKPQMVSLLRQWTLK